MSLLVGWRELPWKKAAQSFFQAELLSILVWSCLGAIVAGVICLLASDHAFDAFLISTYLPPAKRFDDPGRYVPFLLTGGAAVVLIVIIRLPRLVRRGATSWFLGVTSGLKVISFTAMLFALSLRRFSIWDRLLADLTVVFVALLGAYALRCLAIYNQSRIPHEADIRVPLRRTITEWTAVSDEPISSWAEDALGRESVVDALTTKILISRAPIIALFGDFGSGKTSTLNLLREHLRGRTVTISFNTWLPGSQETLTSYLMADIASECQKKYMVPGLRRSTTQLANALAETVSWLKGLPELFTTRTQKDDIEDLGAALRRLPKRVVVLLDELDRMEATELRPLLKVIRGISDLPNLTFVCAAERETLINTVRGSVNDQSYLYFEKFFPVAIQLPKISDTDLRKAGVQRLSSALKSRSWFDTEAEEQSFEEKIGKIWDDLIAPSCRTLRAIGLLANDVGVAAAPLRREVDPIDLVLIELLSRFKRSVYEIVARNSVVLTGGPGPFRGGSYRTDEDKKTLSKRFMDDLEKASESPEQAYYLKGILSELFPLFTEIEGQKSWQFRGADIKRDSAEKRISDPDMFSTYFRHELPSAIFSSVDLENLARRSEQLPSAEQGDLFLEELRSMEKGSLRRDDFLRKVAESVATLKLQVARSWTIAAVHASNEVTYDIFTAFGESGHIVRMIIRFALRLGKAEHASFLSECMEIASDDTLAFRILTTLTDPNSDANLSVSFAQLYPTFTRRMRSRYGRDVDIAKVDMSTSDPRAFDFWGSPDLERYGVKVDPQDREIQQDFWKRYIGQSKGRLIKTFNELLMPASWAYSSDPTPSVENKMSVDLIRKLFNELPDDYDPAELPQKYVRRLRRFLNGEFKNGIGIGQMNDDSDDRDQTDKNDSV